MMYKDYKRPAYEWLPDIPHHWHELFIQQVSHEQKNKNTGNIEGLVLSLSYGNIIRKKNVDAGLVAKDLSTYQIVDKDNIILRFTDLQNDHKSLRTGLVKERGIITSAYTCIVPTINAAYLHYVLHSYDTQKVFYGMGGGVRQSIGFDDIRHMFVPVPPREEQDQIVRYLDWKTSRINKLIHGYQREIRLLEERKLTIINIAVTKGLNSNIRYKSVDSNWTGDIPEHWDFGTIKQHFRIQKRIAGKEGYNVISITQQGLKVKDVASNEGQIAASYANYQFVYSGEYAMNHMDLLTGYVGLSDKFGVTSPDYRVFTLEDVENCDPKYYLYIFQLGYKRQIFYGLGKGAASKGRWRMPAINFKNFGIPIPPIDEQREIVRYIEAQEKKIDELIAGIETHISLLKEYRTRIISDVVTGQIDVRGMSIPEYEHENDIDESEAVEDEEAEE